MLDLIMSTEDLATELQLAAADVAIEQQLPAPPTAQQVEAIGTFTDHLVLNEVPEQLPDSFGFGLDSNEQVAVLSEVKDKVAELWKNFSEWRSSTFRGAKDKLAALAEKIVGTAKWLGVSVEHLIGRLQRRVTAALVANAVISSFSVGSGAEQVSFIPSDITVKTTVKSSPSLASLDLTGAVKLLSGLLSLEVDVAVKYGVKS